jgi:fused signal recognition particle receptor
MEKKTSRKQGWFSRLFGKSDSVASTEEAEVQVEEQPGEAAPEEPAGEVVPEAVSDSGVPAVESPVEPVSEPPVEFSLPEIEAPVPVEPEPETVTVDSEPLVAPAPEVEPESQPEEPEAVQAAPAKEPEEEKLGFFVRLKRQLSRTKDTLVSRVREAITLHGKADEELLEEIETILIQADVGIETTTKIVERMRKDREARKAGSPDALITVFKQALAEIVSHDERTLRLRSGEPTIMLVIGVNGVGKTTTIGKIAKQYHEQGKRVMLVAGDTFRAAAVEQLTIWAERTDSLLVKREMGADSAAVCYEALASPEARECDVILIDTAGRLHTKSNLMEELKKIYRVIKKVNPDAPHETLLILDATTGQNALNQARIFGEVAPVTGLIMTKLDGTAKGGILVALRDLFDIPVLKIGIGEGEDDLRDFDPQAYIDALFEE